MTTQTKAAEAEWTHVGAESDLEVGRFVIMDLDGSEVGVLKTTEGELFAVRNVCPHRLAPVCRGQVSGTMLPSAHGTLEYGMGGTVLRCPWHGWEFDLGSGAGLFGVTKARLRMFDVRIDDGQVYLRRRRAGGR